MRTVSTTITFILAIGLFAGSAVGVAAQDREAAGPVEFTAEWAFRRGCCNAIEPASDPRFDGEIDATFEEESHLLDEGTLRVVTRAFHVVNDEGSWRGIPRQVLYYPDGSASATTETFIGEGNYAGSYAVVDTTTLPTVGVTLHGFIFEGETPSE